jgi:glutaredoxin 3
VKYGGTTMKVKVYSTPNCPKCRALKEHLHSMNITFTEANLEDTCVSAELIMRNIAVLSAPMLEVEDTIFPESEFFDDNSLNVTKLSNILTVLT